MKYHFTKNEVKDLLYDYNSNKNLYPKYKPESVEIWDETLRDGEQSPGVYLTKDEKIRIAKKLDRVGVALIAVGFPAVSKGEFETVKAICDENLSHSKILAISRPKQSDIDACIKAGLDEIVMFMPVSDLLMKVLKTTPEEECELVSKMITYAKDHGLEVNWVNEDSSRANPKHLVKMFRNAVENGAKRIVLTDTVGILNTRSVGYLTHMIMDKVLKKHPEVALGVHMHNDFGMAVANTIEGVFHGATFPHTCVNGYGERAGNAALEEVVMGLEHNGINTGIKLEKLPELSSLVEELFCLPLAAHKPIVGDLCFSHESGLHVNAILSHPMTYEPFYPKIIGRNRKFYLGKLSGSGAIENALAEKLQLIDLHFPIEVVREIAQKVKNSQEQAPKDEMKVVFREIKNNMQKISAGVTDKQFYEIVRKVSGDKLKDYLNDNMGMMEDLEKDSEKEN
ncbi:MAG: homoaconitate hydratase [archaeon]|nr:homoaconitate hydratase [archaeon]